MTDEQDERPGPAPISINQFFETQLRVARVLSVERIAGGFRFSGRGWGHGVGMCQWGAIEMGRKGATETEILRYYYPGVDFTKIY